MSKTVLYRSFKAGAIPPDARTQVRLEGVLLSDEGIGGTVTYRNFRAPGRYHGWKKSWFSGSLVVTRDHLLAFRYSKPIVGIAWSDQQIGKLIISVEKKHTLCIAFDAAIFNDDWSGQMEVRYSTPLARSFLEKITRRIGEAA